MPRVGIVVVSHSRPLAQAGVELASQMVAADPPRMEIAAGTADGGLGTDATAVMAAVEAADEGAGVAIFVDLGSAIMSADLALEMLGDAITARILAAPFVEGLVAAAVMAANGATLAAIDEEARGALSAKLAALGIEEAAASSPEPAAVAAGPSTGSATIVNQVGLHARPASTLAALVSRFDADVRVGIEGKDKRVKAVSSLSLMSLGAAKGSVLVFEATGPEQDAVVAAITELVASGFGEE
ncbi:MAG: dihydroxyacetone kinase phosphoryl donor subunit DhaM [Arachnia sp.]